MPASPRNITRRTCLATVVALALFALWPTAVSASTHARREQWDGFPSVSANYAAGRDTIAVRVRHLVDSLQTARGTSRKP